MYDLYNLDNKLYTKSVHKLIYLMKYRGFKDLPLGDWPQNPVGLAYRQLYPVYEFQYYNKSITTGSCLVTKINIPVKMVCDVFQKECLL